jgi:hypothetical protein
MMSEFEHKFRLVHRSFLAFPCKTTENCSLQLQPVWLCIGCSCKAYKQMCKFLPTPTSMFLYTCTCLLETIALCLQFCQHLPDNLETSGFPFTRHFPTMACPPSLQWFQHIGKEEVLTLWGQMPHA